MVILLLFRIMFYCLTTMSKSGSMPLFLRLCTSRYYSHKSYNVDHGNRLQIPIFSYMVLEYRPAHSLCKPSMQTVLMLIGLDTLQAARQLEFFKGRSETGGPTTEVLADALAIAKYHDAVTGTSKQHVADDYAKRLFIGYKKLRI